MRRGLPAEPRRGHLRLAEDVGPAETLVVARWGGTGPEDRAEPILLGRLFDSSDGRRAFRIVDTLEEAAVASDNPHVIALRSSAEAVLREAMGRDVPPSIALADWISEAETLLATCRRLRGRITLLHSGAVRAPGLIEELRERLNLGPEAENADASGVNAILEWTGAEADTPAEADLEDDLLAAKDPVLEALAAAFVARSTRARLLAAELDAFTLVAPEADSGAGGEAARLDAALARYGRLRARLAAADSERTAQADRLGEVQELLRRQAGALEIVLADAEEATALVRTRIQRVLGEGAPGAAWPALAGVLLGATPGAGTPPSPDAPAAASPAKGAAPRDELKPGWTADLIPGLSLAETTVCRDGRVEIEPGAAGHAIWGPYLRTVPGWYRLDLRLTAARAGRLGRAERRPLVVELAWDVDRIALSETLPAPRFGGGRIAFSRETELPDLSVAEIRAGLEARLWTDGDWRVVVEAMTLTRLNRPSPPSAGADAAEGAARAGGASGS